MFSLILANDFKHRQVYITSPWYASDINFQISRTPFSGNVNNNIVITGDIALVDESAAQIKLPAL